MHSFFAFDSTVPVRVFERASECPLSLHLLLEIFLPSRPIHSFDYLCANTSTLIYLGISFLSLLFGSEQKKKEETFFSCGRFTSFHLLYSFLCFFFAKSFTIVCYFECVFFFRS